jgi:uncharacterized membrane-anchored protein
MKTKILITASVFSLAVLVFLTPLLVSTGLTPQDWIALTASTLTIIGAVAVRLLLPNKENQW